MKGDKNANAKSSLNLMSLGAKKGDKLVIQAEGEDEEAAVEELAALIEEG
jgi:phosphotransferase system HPr (HPr) family protein